MVRTVLEENPEAMNDLMKLYATDVALLAHSGIVSEDGTKKVHLIHLGSLGDCPALAKIAGFSRTFSHVPRAVASARACSGICPWCLAGQEANAHQRAYPFEDYSMHPCWQETIEQILPWSSTPPCWKAFQSTQVGLLISLQQTYGTTLALGWESSGWAVALCH